MMMGLIVSVMGTMIGGGWFLLHQISSQFHALRHELEIKIEATENRSNDRMQKLEDRMESRMQQLENRVERGCRSWKMGRSTWAGRLPAWKACSVPANSLPECLRPPDHDSSHRHKRTGTVRI